MFYQHFFSLNHTLTQPLFTQPLVTQPMLCAVHPTPSQHPCYPPTMSLSKPFSLLYSIITPTLHDHPRTNLMPWKIAINRSARAVFAEWDQFGFLFGVCDDAVWAVFNTPPGGVLRARPDFPVPAALAAGDSPAVRDAFKRATDARSAWLAVSAAFCAAVLDSIGESNRLAISDPDTDTLHLSPRDIINAMTDCSPRGNDGCRGRRPASASEEKACSPSRPSCTHCNVSRTPCPAQHSRTYSSCARCVQTFSGISVPFHRSPPVHFIVYGAKRGNWTADVRGLRNLPVGPTLQHPRPLQPSALRWQHRRVRGRSE